MKRVEERTRLREPRFTASKFLGPRIYRFGHGGHVRIPPERRFRPLTAASCQKGIPFDKLKRKEEACKEPPSFLKRRIKNIIYELLHSYRIFEEF